MIKAEIDHTSQDDQAVKTVPENAQYQESLADYQVNELWRQSTEASDWHEIRKNFSGNLFKLTIFWLSVVVLAVFLQGFSVADFSLPDSVLITFISSTTVCVTGLFLVAAKWMFSRPQ